MKKNYLTIIKIMIIGLLLLPLGLSSLKAEAETVIAPTPGDPIHIYEMQPEDTRIKGFIGGMKSSNYNVLYIRELGASRWIILNPTTGYISNGRFFIVPPTSNGKVGNKGKKWEVMATYIDPRGVTWVAKGSREVGVGDYVPPTNLGTVVANDFNIGRDTDVTGTTKGDIAHVALFVNGNRVGTKQPVTNGQFKLNSWGQITNLTDVVKVQGYNAKGYEENWAPVKLTEDNELYANPYSIISGNNITGWYIGHFEDIYLVVNGNQVGKAEIDPVTKTYLFKDVKNFITSPQDKVFVFGVTRNGEEATVAVKLTWRLSPI